jgi:hypothetical protein
MRGYTVKSPENVALARRMREEGKVLREIGEHLGVRRSTVDTWLKDPDGKLTRARKDSYAQPCVDCGGPTSGSEGRRETPRCQRCANIHCAAETQVWTRAAIVLAIQEWAAAYGQPPAIADWSRAARYEQADGQWPSYQSAVRRWGSWNAAIAAAGFTPRPPHGGGGNEHRRRRTKATA